MSRFSILTLATLVFAGCFEDGVIEDTSGPVVGGDFEPLGYTVVEVRQIERTCLSAPGAFHVRRDLGVEPVWWQIDIGYPTTHLRDGVWLLWEPMVPDPERRAWDTPLWPDNYANDTVEVYQRGTTITFPCGYPWERGLYLRGEGGLSGNALRYRITYGVAVEQ